MVARSKMLRNVASISQQHFQKSVRCANTFLTNHHDFQNVNKPLLRCDHQIANTILIRTNHLNRTKQPVLSTINIWKGMTLKELAQQAKLPLSTIREVMKDIQMKEIRDLNDIKDLASELERKFKVIPNPEEEEKIETVETEQDLIEQFKVPIGSKKVPKIPVVTIMGHVDHGKTTLLDSLRSSEITKNEFGGITQHTGAFTVSLDDAKQKKSKKKSLVMSETFSNLITFLDTPGHAAFSKMRERGTMITDFIILVIAAEDGVMPQTIESIQFAQKHNVPIIVALNKIDKLERMSEKEYNAAIEKISSKLFENGVELESIGGDVQMVKISALEKIGLDELKEAILAQTETLELHCLIDGGVEATIIESTVDKQKGKLTSILVQSGTLKKGDVLITENGLSYARVRAILDENMQIVDNIRPGFSVQVVGWRETTHYSPQAGDKLIQITDEKAASKIVQKAVELMKHEKAKKDTEEYFKNTAEHRQKHQEFLSFKIKEKKRWLKMQTEKKKFLKVDLEEEKKKVNIVLKADVFGTLESILELLSDYPEEHGIRINVLNYGVGAVGEHDLEVADMFHNVTIYAFNTTVANKEIEVLAKEKNVKLKNFNVIYHLINDVRKEIESRMPEVEHHNVVGEAIVLKPFLINERSKKVAVAGSICEKGVLKNDRSVLYKIERNGQLLVKDIQISSMRHLKDEVKEIKEKTECGLMFKEFKDAFLPGDKIICYKSSLLKPKTKWTPKGFDHNSE